PVGQGPPPDDLTYREQEDHGAGNREREDDRDELRGSGPGGHMDEPGSWLDDVDEDDQRSIDECLDQERDKKRSLLDQPSWPRTRPEDLQKPEGQTQEEPMDCPDEDPKSRGPVGRDVEQRTVDTTKDRARAQSPPP